MTTDGDKERLIVILGPTATGKTNLAVHIANALGTSIVSGDSMLVYRGFDIGSAKPNDLERGGVRHALIDILPPDASFNVSEFQRLASAEIHAVNAAGTIPILVGGTGLYLKSLLEGYRFNQEPADSEYRASLEKLAQEHGKSYVHDMLATVDPEAAARLHENDFRRVVRAMEVWHLGKSQISQEKRKSGLVYDACVIGLRCKREILYERIEKRVDAMIAAGLEDEVRQLLDSGISRKAQAMQGIGYKEMAACLAGELTLEQAVADVKKATRHFAKRQLTWYKKMEYISWIDVDEMPFSGTLKKALAEIKKHFLIS